ncbi:MAG: LPP20 family lipoprotein [Armatimonadetes bacterium]|nr:LPP20 family lipoprotein [Armatimonadota bacterium]
MKSLRLLTLAVLVANVYAASAQDVVDKAGEYASINWTKGVITATGLGPLANESMRNSPLEKVKAQRVAMVDAQRHLAEAVAGVKVTSETTVSMYQLTQDEIRSTVSAVLRGYSVVSRRWTEDNTIYEIVLQLGLAPQEAGATSLATAVVPQVEPRIEQETITKTQVCIEEKKTEIKTEVATVQVVVPPKVEKPVDIPADPPKPATPVPTRKPGPYTGLVIDTRGFHLERAMSPKVVTSDQSEVWGTVHVSREFVLDTGIVGYLPSLDMALDANHSRAGKNPLVVRAIGRHGSFRANPVVDDEDATLIKSENGKSKFLDQFRVVFVVDPK